MGSMKTSAYAAAYGPTLQPMHFGAISLDVQIQELKALLLTVLDLPPRCGIHRQSAPCIAHIFTTLYLATETLQFQTRMEDNTHRAHNVHNSKRVQNYTCQDISVSTMTRLQSVLPENWGSTSIRCSGFVIPHNVRSSYWKPQPRG
jgi:hypothetical protein